ncbi:clostripain-related cysteine peptidase [Rhodocytophaga aerolata]|uniref:Clostripain-related cysteine peptidase n=1 Tax=Rhodocytophaga aerolata TaxID=455078 RepID=A0ABT8QZ11_9BACT|nr:clostripain-related cysteine peptidase [Rhodocytophaga aerolata]MDO1444641.1 clostripain-related cysteine peptidase [Rhodocytophaga aerolata]
MRFFITAIFFFVFTFQLSAQKDWTIMVYVAADNNLDPYAELDLIEMLKPKLPDNINLLVQLDKSNNTDWADWITCRRFEIENGLKYKTEYLEDIGEINTGDPKELTKFIDWSVAKFPAKKYGLIIWNHGDGWRKQNFVEEKRPDPIFKAIASDDNGGDKLYMHEVSEALKKCKSNFKQNKLEFIGFDACLMSMLEVWYEVKDFAKYGVGSEDLEPGLGWPYDKLVESLSKPEFNDTKKLVQSLVKNYGNYYIDNSDKFQYTQSSIDLSQVSKFATDLSALSICLLKYPEIIKVARQNCNTPYGYQKEDAWPNGIDLKKFLLEYKTNSNDEQLNTSIAELLKLFDKLVLNNVSDKVNKDKRGSYGLAIYFPESVQIFKLDPDGSAYSKNNTDNPVAFVKNEKWVDFLNAYYKSSGKDRVGQQLTSPLNPEPSDAEIALYKKIQSAYSGKHSAQSEKLSTLLLDFKESFHQDTLNFVKSLSNVLLPFFETQEYGLVDTYELQPMINALESSLNTSYLRKFTGYLMGMYLWVDEQNSNGELNPPAYGILSVIGELTWPLEKDPINHMLLNMMLADNYARLQRFWLGDNRQVRTALNSEITEADDKEDYDRDRCYLRAKHYYDRSLDFINSLSPGDARVPALKFFTYYGLTKLSSNYFFLHDSTLYYIKQLESVIPDFLKIEPVQNSEYLSIYQMKINALYADKNYIAIQNIASEYYKYIEIEKPSDKILLSNGVMDLEEAGSASELFPNARLIASPALENNDVKALNRIVSVLFKQRKTVNPYAFIEAFEHKRWIESPLNSQVVGMPQESKILRLVSDLSAITKFEYDRVQSREILPFEIDTNKVANKNYVYFHFSYADRAMYVLMKSDSKYSVDTIAYSEAFDFNYQRERSMEKQYELARETRIYNVIDNFFVSAKSKEIIVIPDHFLFQIPLDGMSDGRGNYLVDKYAFTYTFNLRKATYHPFSMINKRMLCISSPKSFTTIFPYLQNGLGESEAIKENLDNQLKLDIISGESATDISINNKIKNYDILHFATHSYFTAQRPFASGIVLSKTTEPIDSGGSFGSAQSTSNTSLDNSKSSASSSYSDGIITAYELLNALKGSDPISLVTLSSCESANGTLVSNGSLGLTYTLLQCNVSNVISSVLKVNDAVGKSFMTKFYNQLSIGKDLVSSLHESKLSIKKQYPSRLFWNTFNLYVP